MLVKLAPYSKFVVALLGAVVTVVVQFYGASKFVVGILPVLTALGVYAKSN